MTYPATTYAEGVELTITSGNQLHEIINGSATEEVDTESGMVPSVRKALADAMLFKPAIAWAEGSVESDPFQTRLYGEGIYWAPAASNETPISMGNNPTTDSNWFLAPVTGGESISRNTNLLSNHNFIIQSPDDITHPSVKPTDYVAGTQIFSGVFVGDDIVGITYIDGRVSWTSGTLYFSVPNSGALEYVDQTEFVASVADFDGKPRTRGVSYALVGDEYRVTVGVDALEDESANATPLGSVKFEQGSVATGHETLASAKELTHAGDSQCSGGVRFPVDSTSPLSLGAQSTPIPIGVTRLIVDTGALSVGEELYLWGSSGDFGGSAQNIINIQPNDFAGYDVTTNIQTYEFITKDIRYLRGDNGFPTLQPEAYPEGWGGKLNDVTFDNYAAIQKALDESKVVRGSVGRYNCLSVNFSIQDGTDFIGAGMKSELYCPTATTPFIKNASGRLIKSKITGWKFTGNLSESPGSENNHGIECNTGMRHCEIVDNDFSAIGGDAMRFVGDISGGGAGIYYNKISYNLIGSALDSSTLTFGSGISVLGTMNQNEISFNTIRNTRKNGMQFLAVAGNGFMQQNNQVFGNSVEGCGRTDTQTRAGIFIGDLVTNVNIWGNYFEQNGSDTAGGADIICNSPTQGIGSAKINFNLFAKAQYNIWVVQFSDLVVTGNWRSGLVADGGLHFVRIDAWNGTSGKDKLHFENNMTHSTCDVPFMEVNVSGYPVGDFISGELASNNTSITPDLHKHSLRERLMEGVTRFYKTGGDGNVVTYESGGAERGFVEVSGSGVNFGSSSARVGLKAGSKELIFDSSLLRTGVDIDTQIGNANFRYKTAYLETAPVVGSDKWLKHGIQAIPQELCDLVMTTEIKQYHLHSSTNEEPRYHYGIIITTEFLDKLDNVYGVDMCGALCRDLFRNESGEVIYKELGGESRCDVWQLRYDEWQNILLEGMRRKIINM